MLSKYDLRLFSRAVESIYAAGLKSELWPETLQHIADVFGDVGTVLMIARSDQSVQNIVSRSLIEAQQDYNDNWWKHDVRSQRGLERGHLLSTNAITDRHLVTEEETRTLPIYTEFLMRHGLGWCGAVSLLPSLRTPVWLSVQRAMAKTPFCDEELELLNDIGRHAENALRIGMRLMDMQAATDGLMRVLSRMDQAIFLVDDVGDIVFANASGESLVGEGFHPARALNQGRQSKTAPLRETEAFDTKPIIYRKLEGRVLLVYQVPFDARAQPTEAFSHKARTLLLVTDRNVHHELDPSVVRDSLELTLAEAKVAALIGSGVATQDAAQRLSVCEETIRSTLKKIYHKTGTKKQADLAHLISRLPF